ncbi:hypothetical protein LTR85_009873 [Meristemomyces frigidus]|nr:hypothetical protein LTR85_009873 [Meristemomyces frigidus]
MTETRHILVLGASYAGLGSAHYFLKHVYPQLPSDPKISYKAILVDPSSKWYQRHASPRAAASPELVPADQVFLDIEPGFKQYGEVFCFVQGKASSWDPEGRKVVVQRADGAEQTIAYHALILATGTKTYSPLFSLQGTAHTDIQAALRTLHGQLTTAKSIVIAGGGATGVEVAGELGETLNGAAGWFARRPSSIETEITLITNSSTLLPGLRPDIATQAETYLNRVGVEVRYSTKVSSTHELPDGRTKIVLHDNEQVEVDIYIPTMGAIPMSEYVPDHLKDEKGYVKQNNQTLRVDAAGPRVYAIGDVGTYSNNRIVDIFNSVPVMETNLQRDLLAAHTDVNARPVGQDRLYVGSKSEDLIMIPIGQSKGVGVVYGWKVPSWFVWLIKGRDYMVPKGKANIDGSNWAKEMPWKVKEL